MQINSIQVAYPRGPIGHTGEDGKSAYDLAVEHGFVGTEQAWIASLKGSDGADGATGPKGEDGEDGKSAYEIAVAQGFAGTLPAWLASLRGADGAPGADGKDGKDGADGLPGPKGEDGKDGAQGADGADGAAGQSAYALAVAQGFVGTEQEWLSSLKGADGEPGPSGLPVFTNKLTAVNDGYELSLSATERGYSVLAVTGDTLVAIDAGTAPQTCESYLLIRGDWTENVQYYDVDFGVAAGLSILGTQAVRVYKGERYEVSAVRVQNTVVILCSGAMR